MKSYDDQNHKYPGIFFSSNLEKGKQATEVTFSQRTINFQGADHNEQWDCQKVDIEVGGSNNHLIFFKNRESENSSFYIQKNSQSLQLLKKLNIEHWLITLQQYSHDSKKTLLIITALISCFVIGLISLFSLRGFITKKIVKTVPYKLERTVGKKIIGIMLPPTKIYQNKDALLHLNKILEPLKKVIPPPYNEFDVFISNDNELNAFALPGGQIVFNLGTLKKAESALEILGVAAHEMAHVHQRHVLRNLIQAVGVFTVLQVFLGDLTGILAVLSDQGTSLFMRGFSREMEIEADEVGVQYLLKAKIHPKGMINFFKKLLAQYDEMGKTGELLKTMQENLDFLNTHPNTESRINNIQKVIDNLSDNTISSFHKFDDDFKNLKDAI